MDGQGGESDVSECIIDSNPMKNAENEEGLNNGARGRNAPQELHSDDETSMMVSEERSMFLKLANVAMNELIMLGQMESPFWRLDSSSQRETLNYEEYRSFFNNGMIMKPAGYVMEASREKSVVHMTCLALVKTLMDTDKWVNVFAPIVSMASVHKVIPSGRSYGPRNGSLQVIQANFQVISPLVPTRQVTFVRYCKMLRKGLWVVVDVTPGPQVLNRLTYGGSNRLPSGLIIEDMNNGYSKVTWIEQAEYDENHIHQLYKLMIGSGIGLGAKRWLMTLQRHCESLSTLSSSKLAQLYPGLSEKGVTEMVRLAQRMTLKYYSGITGSSEFNWVKLNIENDGQKSQNMSLMIRKNMNNPDELTGIVFSVSTSVRFLVNQKTLFDFLSNLSFRDKWDILTCNTYMQETIRIPKVHRIGNYVSLLQISRNGMFVLQEIWNDDSGATVVYAPVESYSIDAVKRGQDSDNVQLLPSGFSILPDGGGGCLLTLGLQILVTGNPNAELNQDSVKTVQELVSCTIDKIKLALNIQA